MQNSGLVDRTIKASEEYAKAQESEKEGFDALDERMKELTSKVGDITGGNGGTGTGGSGGRSRRRRQYRRRKHRFFKTNTR